MKYDVTFTEQAENDLRGIFEYIAFDFLSPENAAGQLDRIEEKILSLGEYADTDESSGKCKKVMLNPMDRKD